MVNEIVSVSGGGAAAQVPHCEDYSQVNASSYSGDPYEEQQTASSPKANDGSHEKGRSIESGVAVPEVQEGDHGAAEEVRAGPEGEEEEPTLSQPTSTVGWTTINMMCNVIGGGVLALPTAFYQSSLLLGIILLFLIASITIANLYFIVHCADFAQVFTYRVLLRKGLGKYEARFVDFALFVYPFGATCAYCRIVADTMPAVIENFLGADPSSFWTSEIAWLIFGGVTFFILSCRRSLSELKVSSLFGLATIFYLVLLVIIRFFDGSYSETDTPAEVHDDFELAYLRVDIFRMIPLIFFALSVHNNAPTYYAELADRSPAKMMKVVMLSHAGIILTYLLMGIFGLLTFGGTIEDSDGDVLNMYRDDDTVINTSRLLMFVHFACVFPIILLAARCGFNNFVFKTNDLQLRFLCIESFFMVLAASLIGGAVPNIATLLSINGALFGSVIVMIAPSLLFLRLDPFNSLSTGRWRRYRVLAITSIVLGVLTAISSITITIMDIVEE